INAAIDQALKEADEKGIVGKEITPFLLGKIKDITDGKSLAANIALVKNNAKVGAQLAVSYQKL
ncbi:MAG TPA: pseudouridine-5'-phosphate glycosidase, partial [Enterococcus sp.]|nr:pseudouridine-5'-phosphate glycosidase [Enterococcus sp.]